MDVALTTSELMESAGAPMRLGLVRLSSRVLLVPATTKTMSYSFCSLSSSEASGEIMFSGDSRHDPRLRFHTLMSGLLATMLRIIFITVKELL